GTIVLGAARRELSDEQFRQQMFQAVGKYSRSQPVEEALWSEIADCWHYHRLRLDQGPDFQGLAQRITDLEASHGSAGCRVFYLAVTPDLLEQVACHLGKVGLNRPAVQDACVRVVVEKPFGQDLLSARGLNECLLRVFQEEQLLRIDHYLGKETVQNLLVLRFANAVIDPLFSRQFVDHVQITTAESAGMEGRRGAYYETAGALRDMVQSHMLQLLALVAMEVPPRMDERAIRNEKVTVLQAVAAITPEQVAQRTVRGQYVAAGDRIGYRQEQGVSPDSDVETYAALTLHVDTWRWAGVPFHLRTGKALAAKTSQIVLVFKREPINLFGELSCDVRGANRLIIRITPNEGMSLVIDGKVPGVDMMLRPMKLDFSYGASFASASPEAYEHLLLDAITGDATLFLRNDEVEAAWRIVDPIRASWNATGMPKLIMYPAGSQGPDEARRLLGDPYKDWFPL
ncbi:MAG: glucose-6-phosphate dehydrogenase, partial [Phycisphaerae bacterium]|nr:glucose-6-phosphate dehydrogenase [Phycisphaerae bacterium]